MHLLTPTMDYHTDISTNSTLTSLTSLELTNASENETCEEIRNAFLSSLSPRKWMLVIFGIYFFFGVFGNGSLVLLFLMKKNLRTINNAFVTNLALSDFLFVLLFAPIKYFEEAYALRPFGKSFCFISIIINYTSQDVSTMSMTALSYLRYRAVTSPMQMRRDDLRMKWFIPVFCIISWVVGIAAAIFPATDCMELKDECLYIDRHMIDSFSNNTHHLAFHIVRFAVFYLLPLAIIASFYSVMAFTLCRTPFSLQRNDSISARRATRSRKKLGGIVLVIVVIFFLSWLPNYLVWFTGLDDNVFEKWLTDMRSICIFLPAFLNPFLFFSTSTKYRKSLLLAFSPWHQSGRVFVRRLRSSSLSASLVSIRLSRLGRYSKRSSSSIPPSPTPT